MNLKLPANDPRSVWIRLGVIAIFIRIVFGFFPNWCEVLYARGLYPWIRTLLDYLIGWLPFPGVYLFFTGVVIWLLPKFKRLHLAVKNKTFSLKAYLFSFSAFLMALVFWFLVLWGYNYARIPMAEQIDLEIPEMMGFDAVWEEAQYIKQTCIQARNAIPNLDTHAITSDYYPDNLEDEMRRLLEEVLADYGYDYSGHVRGRLLKPKGTLLRFNSSGVYFPFTGEGHVDDGLYIISKPFTMAHELGHGYGFGNEAVCNFLGYLSCIRSENPAIRYAGYLMYWRYVYGALMEFMTEEEYQQERATISRGMYNDIEAIYAAQDQYAPFIPFLQPVVYDVFLKVQGVTDGIESYDKMVLLVSSWRKKFR